MSIDVEAGGAAATAGLAAKAIDEAQSCRPDQPVAKCANCGTPLVGAFCHACGQTGHVHRSLWHMMEESLHGVLHFDSKSWRTLPLLIAKPGVLTRRYIDGQRVRYVSPLALFLFTIFLMFFVVSSVVDAPQGTLEEQSDARAQLTARLQEAQARVTQANAALAAATDERAREASAKELQVAQEEARELKMVLEVFAEATDGGLSDAPTTLTAEELRVLLAETELGESTLRIGEKFIDNPELMLYKIKNTAYKFSFMLIPISMPFLWLMFFWRKNVTLYDHMVFSMYSLSFTSMLVIVMALMSTTEFTSRVMGWLLFVPPIHMYLQLRGTYGLSRSSAVWRTIALLISAGTVFVLFLVLVATISVSGF